jgi:succinylglutamic semialdehyde dehydrogenase
MRECWMQAGLPEGALEIVQGGGDVGRALAGHEGIDGLLFTGSATTGHALARQFAETPHKILALEMGGNNPLIAWDVRDADLPAAATLIVQSAFLSAGQRCTCARRLIVEEGKHEPLIAHVTALMDKLIVGAPFDEPQPFMGPVVDNRAADRLLDQVASLKAGGAVPIRPLTRSVSGRPFLTPALLDVTDVPHRPDEEMFGPVLQLIRVPDFSAAMMEANATRFGLSAGLIGGDQALYDRFWSGARAGIVNWNRPTVGAASNAPFGGIGASGNHRPSAYYAADYCAFPVASLEESKVRGVIATGLKADEA